MQRKNSTKSDRRPAQQTDPAQAQQGDEESGHQTDHNRKAGDLQAQDQAFEQRVEVLPDEEEVEVVVHLTPVGPRLPRSWDFRLT